jgi:hypothetical protein
MAGSDSSDAIAHLMEFTTGSSLSGAGDATSFISFIAGLSCLGGGGSLTRHRVVAWELVDLSLWNPETDQLMLDLSL